MIPFSIVFVSKQIFMSNRYIDISLLEIEQSVLITRLTITNRQSIFTVVK